MSVRSRKEDRMCTGIIHDSIILTKVDERAFEFLKEFDYAAIECRLTAKVLTEQNEASWSPLTKEDLEKVNKSLV